MKNNGQRYHFLYKSTNLINGKFYFGVHSTYNLKDGYLGSGKRLSRAVKKYGKQNFKCEILEFFESREKLLQREKEIVNEQLINDPLCMNLQPGGGGGISSKEHHKKMRKGSSKWISEKWKDVNYRKKHLERVTKQMTQLNKEKRIKYVGGLNRKVSDETKRKIGRANSIKQKGEYNSQYGTCWIKKEKEVKKIKKENLQQYLNEGWSLGRK